jgi:hypothetical protein
MAGSISGCSIICSGAGENREIPNASLPGVTRQSMRPRHVLGLSEHLAPRRLSMDTRVRPAHDEHKTTRRWLSTLLAVTGNRTLGADRGACRDVNELVAIDVHTHAEEPCGTHPDDGYDELQAAMAVYFNQPNNRPTIEETARYYRERKIGAVIFPSMPSARPATAAMPTRRSRRRPPPTATF